MTALEHQITGNSIVQQLVHPNVLCEGNLSVTDGFPTQRATDAENVSAIMYTEYYRLSVCRDSVHQGIVYMVITRGPVTNIFLTLVPKWISNHFHHDMQDEFTYQFPNFNGAKFGNG